MNYFYLSSGINYIVLASYFLSISEDWKCTFSYSEFKCAE